MTCAKLDPVLKLKDAVVSGVELACHPDPENDVVR